MPENKPKLLILEDDDTLRKRLCRSMERRGFCVRSASSVAEAKIEIAADEMDFAIVDLRLLDGSGLDVIYELELKHPNLRSLVLTGYGNIPTAVSAVRLGAVDYIAKPASADEIVDALLAPRDKHAPAPENPINPEQARWEHIEHVYEDAGKNVAATARLLNMHRRSLQRTLRRHGV